MQRTEACFLWPPSSCSCSNKCKMISTLWEMGERTEWIEIPCKIPVSISQGCLTITTTIIDWANCVDHMGCWQPKASVWKVCDNQTANRYSMTDLIDLTLITDKWWCCPGWTLVCRLCRKSLRSNSCFSCRAADPWTYFRDLITSF